MLGMSLVKTRSEQPARPSAFPQWAAKLRARLTLAGISDKEAAFIMDQLDPAEFSRQMNERPGHHFSLPRLFMLPDAVTDAFLKDWAEHRGFKLTSIDLQSKLIADLLRSVADIFGLASLASETEQPERKRA